MEKEIKEITFGTKDSELYKFEYTIPEGYEAEIKDGKVIMTKKESEDERITRAINNMLPFIPDEAYANNGVTKEGVLNWLEKQKEQKPIFKKGDKVIWDDEEFNILDVNETEYNVGGYRVPFSRQNELHPIWQKSAEWSEEDERTLESFLGWLQGSMGEKTYSSWLKSLPERFSLKPKQEWSEEDEIYLQDALWCVEKAEKSCEDEEDKGACWSAKRWLKSLRPVSKESLQSHWKPSEEQIRTLDIVISDYRHACTKDSDKKAETLKPLLEQLEKL